MTPAERMHAQMLAQLGLTEDQFKAMDPAAQQKIEDKIREMIKQQVENSTDKRTGMITDKSA
jgi:TPP-dependent pyruvate/acetoin dehydrogenase alpha subunit